MMTTPVRLFAVSLLLTALCCAQRTEPPRLVVLCAIDQLATWVYEQSLPHFAEDGGFRRLRREGAAFPNCAYQHACTETGPGHATISTGAPAAVHGIVRNDWWSPAEGRSVYCVGHPASPLPGMLSGKDRGANRLLVETLSGVMRREIPGFKTASVAWKDRSAILMVGREADVAAWIELQHGDLVTNTTWCADVPEWIAKFNRERRIDGYHGKIWERFGPDSAYVGLVDDRPYEMPHLNSANQRTLPQVLDGGKDEPDYGYYNQIYYSPFGNELVRLAAEAAIEGMDLGADDVPDLLCVGFSSIDTVGHHFGQDSVEARDNLLRLDRQLAILLDYLDGKVGEGRYTMFLTGDHGVAPTPEAAKARGLDAGRGLIQTQARAVAEREIIKKFGKGAAGRRYCQHVGEWGLVFDKLAFERGDGKAAAATRFRLACELAARSVTMVRGIEAAYTTRDVLDNPPGDDPFRIALRAALHPDRGGDVQLVVKRYWLDGTLPASHGTPHDYDREVVGFAFGLGVPAGARIEDPMTPGFGAVLLADVLGIPRPAHAVDEMPAAFKADK